MNNSGKWLIAFIFGTALAMAIFAWSFQYLRGRRVLDLYGADAARLTRVDADRVELLLLEKSSAAAPTATAETLEIDQSVFSVANTIDITKARGLIHARQALIEDSSYDWNRAAGDCTPKWPFAIRFSRGETRVTAAIDIECRQLLLVEKKAKAPLAEHFVRGIQTFVDEQVKANSRR